MRGDFFVIIHIYMTEHYGSKHVLDLRGKKPGLKSVGRKKSIEKNPGTSYRTILVVCLTLVTTMTAVIYSWGIHVGASLNAKEPLYSESFVHTETAAALASVADISEEDVSGTLEEIIQKAAASEPGEISVLVEALDDGNYSAGVNTREVFNPYSTYKLFIAWLVLDRVDKGELNYGDRVFEGRNVRECLEDMILLSDNKCPETFFQILDGRAAIERAVRASGFKDTKFVGELESTVVDQIIFLRRLYRGELLSESSTQYLLELMKNQKFREGITTGADAPVANKVGFLHEYLHDSAIVYGSKGVYGISIYTKDSSWEAISRISRKVHTSLEK
jgi:beta-lactamase class A